jgi:hypothetical protein
MLACDTPLPYTLRNPRQSCVLKIRQLTIWTGVPGQEGGPSDLKRHRSTF